MVARILIGLPGVRRGVPRRERASVMSIEMLRSPSSATRNWLPVTLQTVPRNWWTPTLVLSTAASGVTSAGHVTTAGFEGVGGCSTAALEPARFESSPKICNCLLLATYTFPFATVGIRLALLFTACVQVPEVAEAYRVIGTETFEFRCGQVFRRLRACILSAVAVIRTPRSLGSGSCL